MMSSPETISATESDDIATSATVTVPSPQSMRMSPMCSAANCGTAKNSIAITSSLGQMTVKTKGWGEEMREADIVLFMRNDAPNCTAALVGSRKSAAADLLRLKAAFRAAGCPTVR